MNSQARQSAGSRKARVGDIVIHAVPPQILGNGPYYVSSVTYGGDESQVAVLALTTSPAMSWEFGVPKSEIEVIGSFGVVNGYRGRRLPFFLVSEVPDLMPLVEAGRRRLDDLYPERVTAREQEQRAAEEAANAPASELEVGTVAAGWSIVHCALRYRRRLVWHCDHFHRLGEDRRVRSCAEEELERRRVAEAAS